MLWRKVFVGQHCREEDIQHNLLSYGPCLLTLPEWSVKEPHCSNFCCAEIPKAGIVLSKSLTSHNHRVNIHSTGLKVLPRMRINGQQSAKMPKRLWKYNAKTQVGKNDPICENNNMPAAYLGQLFTSIFHWYVAISQQFNKYCWNQVLLKHNKLASNLGPAGVQQCIFIQKGFA